MEIMIRRVKNETKTIADMIVASVGIVNAQAKSSTKLKLNMVWLSNDSAPTHLAAAIMMEMRAKAAKGANIYIIIV
jgi:hypothetical protein